MIIAEKNLIKEKFDLAKTLRSKEQIIRYHKKQTLLSREALETQKHLYSNAIYNCTEQVIYNKALNKRKRKYRHRLYFMYISFLIMLILFFIKWH